MNSSQEKPKKKESGWADGGKMGESTLSWGGERERVTFHRSTQLHIQTKKNKKIIVFVTRTRTHTEEKGEGKQMRIVRFTTANTRRNEETIAPPFSLNLVFTHVPFLGGSSFLPSPPFLYVVSFSFSILFKERGGIEIRASWKGGEKKEKRNM